jgi:hypothetical protein
MVGAAGDSLTVGEWAVGEFPGDAPGRGQGAVDSDEPHAPVVAGAEPQVLLSPPVDLGFEPLSQRRHAKKFSEGESTDRLGTARCPNVALDSPAELVAKSEKSPAEQGLYFVRPQGLEP